MPELPEVETVRKGLEPHLVGARLLQVDQRRKDLRFPFPEDFAARLEGTRVLSVGRRAKYLLIALDRGETMLAHLGMTGRFTIDQVAPGLFHRTEGLDERHTHLVLYTDRGEQIAFHDVRRFGYMDLIPTDHLMASAHLAGLGPEPLDAAFGAKTLTAGFKGRRQNVKVSLLDQRLVAGLGNIYVCEALHRARIDPTTEAGALGAAALKRLTAQIKAVLEEAIVAGGSTLRDYRAADGALGYFQHRFAAYGREGEGCVREGCGGVISRLVQGGRSTFYCPSCQR
jgi:formamidopyrimidine-DNA glycosylase